MDRYNLLLAAIVCIIGGCASAPTQTASNPDDKTVVTGSRLPARDRESNSSVRSIDSKQDVGDMMQRGNATGLQPRGGGM